MRPLFDIMFGCYRWTAGTLTFYSAATVQARACSGRTIKCWGFCRMLCVLCLILIFAFLLMHWVKKKPKKKKRWNDSFILCFHIWLFNMLVYHSLLKQLPQLKSEKHILFEHLGVWGEEKGPLMSASTALVVSCGAAVALDICTVHLSWVPGLIVPL